VPLHLKTNFAFVPSVYPFAGTHKLPFHKNLIKGIEDIHFSYFERNTSRASLRTPSFLATNSGFNIPNPQSGANTNLLGSNPVLSIIWTYTHHNINIKRTTTIVCGYILHRPVPQFLQQKMYVIGRLSHNPIQCPFSSLI